jgi:predicted aminopeptidase
MTTSIGEDADPLAAAQAELDRWCAHYAALIDTDTVRYRVKRQRLALDTVRWREARQAIVTDQQHLPDDLARRLSEVLGGCRTPEDVRLVFASVQEGQLVG